MANNKCALCNLEFKNDEQLNQHKEGKRHKKLESIRDEREKTAARSLFVSGLKKNTFTKHLEEHFQQFGKINKIIPDQDKNAYAIIEYEDESSIEKALNHSGEHRVNDKCVKISKRELKEFVSKIGNNTEKKKEILDKLKEEALIVNTFLGKCNSFDEQVDKLIYYLKISEEQTSQRELICKDLNDVFKTFWNENEFNVSIFGSTANSLACNGSDMDLTLLFSKYLVENQMKQQKLPKIVEKQLKQNKQPKSETVVNPDNSDSNMDTPTEEITEMDENFDLMGDEPNENDNQSDKSLKESIKKFFSEKQHGEFLNFDIEHQIKITARILQRSYRDMQFLKTITNTRCPIVRFTHEKGINCDITLNNYLAVENTKLIKLYMDLEPNLRKAIFIIRYWLKHKNLYSLSRFNSYMAIWLVIFYMQQRNVGYLPTVDALSKMTNQVKEIHGWNCAFETNIEKIKASRPTDYQQSIDSSSVNDLLKGFFEFYSTFKFDPSHMICTRTAKLVPITESNEISKTSDFMNMQDPFDLSHNISVNLCKNSLERFVFECKGSSDLLQYSNPPKKSASKGWGLILLMTRKAVPVLSPNSSTKLALMTKDLVEKSLVKLKLFDDDQMHNNENENNIKKPELVSQINEISVRRAIDFVLFLLNDCLMLNKVNQEDFIAQKRKRIPVLNQICDKVDSLGLNCSPKRLKINSADPEKPNLNTYVCVIDENLNNNGKDHPDDDEKNQKLIASFQLQAVKNTWQGRRALKRELKQKNPTLNSLDLEVETSKKLAEVNSFELKAPITFRIQFLSDQNSHEDSEAVMTSNGKTLLSSIQVKFDLLDEIQNQTDLINFTTMVHFLDVYLNNSQEKLFTEWNNKMQQNA